MNGNSVELSILISTRNDESLIGPILDRVQEAVKQISRAFELIVIDADSTDRTRAIAEQEGARVIHLSPRPTYGEIVQKGFEHARGKYIITLDADLLSDYGIIHRFWERRHSSELILGSRYMEGGAARMPVLRSAYTVLCTPTGSMSTLQKCFLMILLITNQSAWHTCSAATVSSQRGGSAYQSPSFQHHDPP